MAGDIQMVFCPIDSKHEMRKENLVKHLLKCMKKNGGRQAWAFCPYNIAHCIPKINLIEHVRTCEEKLEDTHVPCSIPKLFENIDHDFQEEIWE